MPFLIETNSFLCCVPYVRHVFAPALSSASSLVKILDRSLSKSRFLENPSSLSRWTTTMSFVVVVVVAVAARRNSRHAMWSSPMPTIYVFQTSARSVFLSNSSWRFSRLNMQFVEQQIFQVSIPHDIQGLNESCIELTEIERTWRSDWHSMIAEKALCFLQWNDIAKHEIDRWLQPS